MRALWIAFLLCALWTFPAAAQEDAACGEALSPRLTVGGSGQVTVDTGFFLNLRAEPGLSGAEVLRLASGEFFEVIGGPECADGLRWWQVRQFGLTGWIAESAGGDYMTAPVDRATQPTLPPLPAAPAGLPPVLLADHPATLNTDFIQWDWDAFLTAIDSWYDPPDPLAVTLPDRYQGRNLPAGPFNLDTVRFVDEVGLNAAQRALLTQNGFVVVPGGMAQFEDAYRWDDAWNPETGHSYWVTTDALLHALHVAFDHLLQFLEQDELTGRLSAVLSASTAAAVEQWEAARGTDLEPAARAAVTYYAVALGLLNPAIYDASVSTAFRAEADPLIDAALEAQGRLDVPFLPQYQEDFSQYKPRGHYTTTPEQEQYFRAMMWLGRITFLAKDDAQLQASLLTLRALNRSGEVENWRSISDVLAFLIGPTDNLGPVEYWPIAEAVFGADLAPEKLADAALLAEFRAQVQALPGPRINNVVRPLGTEAEELDEATRGFRLFGQRFTFDGYAMQRLIYPYVGVVGNERKLPSGLDVAAALGSDMAYRLLEQRGDTAYENYVENLLALRSDVSQMNPPDWLQNAYGGWLWALQPLWARPAEVYPPLFSTEAWLLRDMQAGLGSWAELKHDTLLYTAQPMGGLGGGGERTVTTFGLIEPNPLVFARIALVSAAVAQGLDARGLGQSDFAANEPPGGTHLVKSAFQNLAELSAMLTEMARKELWGEPLTDDEQLFLKYDFGSKLWQVRYLAELPLADPPKVAAIVADVASNPDAGTVLQVATGEVDYIYVITDSPTGLQLTRGTVYSYYEFVQPIDNRLSDEEWRAALAAGEVPPRPDWISLFFAP
jgi:hypothetical protein